MNALESGALWYSVGGERSYYGDAGTERCYFGDYAGRWRVYLVGWWIGAPAVIDDFGDLVKVAE